MLFVRKNCDVLMAVSCRLSAESGGRLNMFFNYRHEMREYGFHFRGTNASNFNRFRGFHWLAVRELDEDKIGENRIGRFAACLG